MARYEKKKPSDFGLGKPTAKEKADAQKISNMSKGKPATSGKKLSAAMFTWAKTNMSKLKNPTKAQKKIFEQYKAMVKAGQSLANPKPKPKPKPKAKPAVQKSKPNTGTGRDGKPGTGTYGKSMPSNPKGMRQGTTFGTTGRFRQSNPPSPTVTKKSGQGGSRARVKKDPRVAAAARNLREANAAAARRERKTQFTQKPYGGHPMNPPKNPKEGDTYKKPFGPVMIFKNGKFVRK